jgi:iron complex outermembrane receptor protein
VGDWSFSRLKSNLGLDWSLGNWNATLAGRYYSGIKDRCWNVSQKIECSNPDDKNSGGGTGYNKLPADFYTDLSIGYKLPWNAKILAGANNLFDKKPRIVYSQGTSSAAAVDAERPLDRFVYVRYNQSF